MVKHSLNRYQYAIAFAVMSIMFFQIICPSNIMCNSLFDDTESATNAIIDIAGAIRQWWFVPFLFFSAIAAFCHNDNLKKSMIAADVAIVIVLVLSLNPEWTINTLEHMAGWFSGGIDNATAGEG